MKQYHDLLQYILDNGKQKSDRTGTGTLSTFGYQMRFDLSEGFPLVTTKKIHLKSVIHELLWFLSGDTNVKYLQENGVKIWDEWADSEGFLGPVYGKQWRSFEGVDQINWIVENLKNDPHSRRHIVSAWNAKDLPKMALAPCHCLFQFYVGGDNKLSLQLYQRSADAFLGVPFNIASYSLLLTMMAQVVGLEVGEYIHSFGDLHLYSDHIDKAKLQLTREPYPLPILKLNSSITEIDQFKYDDFKIENYQYHPHIKAKVSV